MTLKQNHEIKIINYIKSICDTTTPTSFVNDFNKSENSRKLVTFLIDTLGMKYQESSDIKLKNYQTIGFNKRERTDPAIDNIVNYITENYAY